MVEAFLCYIAFMIAFLAVANVVAHMKISELEERIKKMEEKS